MKMEREMKWSILWMFTMLRILLCYYYDGMERSGYPRFLGWSLDNVRLWFSVILHSLLDTSENIMTIIQAPVASTSIEYRSDKTINTYIVPSVLCYTIYPKCHSFNAFQHISNFTSIDWTLMLCTNFAVTHPSGFDPSAL
jgi:hypothetical protein